MTLRWGDFVLEAVRDDPDWCVVGGWRVYLLSLLYRADDGTFVLPVFSLEGKMAGVLIWRFALMVSWGF